MTDTRARRDVAYLAGPAVRLTSDNPADNKRPRCSTSFGRGLISEMWVAGLKSTRKPQNERAPESRRCVTSFSWLSQLPLLGSTDSPRQPLVKVGLYLLNGGGADEFKTTE